MQVQINLSKKEKQYYFSYLLGMLLFISALTIFILIKNFESPFHNQDIISIQTLSEKTKFDEQQKQVQPILDSTFTKIFKLKIDQKNSVRNYEIDNNINDIANFFESSNLKDPRKNSYIKIAKFYKIYLDDKNFEANRKYNIGIYQKQFNDCSIGFQTRQQQIIQLSNK